MTKPAILPRIHTPADLKPLARHELRALADELRQFVLESAVAKLIPPS